MAQEFNAPPGSQMPTQRRNNRLIVGIVIALVLCCCCGLVAFGYWFYQYGGDQLLGLSRQIVDLVI
jgi:hypothetical protein